MYRIILSIIMLIMSFGLTAYPQAPAQPPAAAVPPQEEPAPVLAVPRDYRYNSRGRRDPFVNPVPKPLSTEPPAAVQRPPGLRGVLVAEAAIADFYSSLETTGYFHNIDLANAQDSAGNYTFSLKCEFSPPRGVAPSPETSQAGAN